MTKLQLNAEEREMLVEILTSYLSDLRFEIADTERLEWRQKLKKREEFLNKLLKDLSA